MRYVMGRLALPDIRTCYKISAVRPVVLVHNQTNRSTEQNGKSRNKPQSIQKCSMCLMRVALQMNKEDMGLKKKKDVGINRIVIWKNKTGSVFHILYQDKLQLD